MKADIPLKQASANVPPAKGGGDAGADLTGRPPVGATGRGGTKPAMGLILSYGWRFLKIQPRYAVLFLVVSLLQMGATIGTPVLFGILTNEIHAPEKVPALVETKTDGVKTDSVAVVTAKEKATTVEAAAAPSIDKKKSMLLYLAWAALLVGGLVLGLTMRYVQTLLDVSMANQIRDHLFSAVLQQSPAFYHSNDSGSLTMIANQMAIETQIALRQMLLDPIVQAVSFGLAISAIAFSFSQLQSQNGGMLWLAVSVVFIFAMLSPALVAKFGGRLQQAASGLRDQMISLSTLVNGAFACPEEIQSFGAEELFAAKHRAALEEFRKARMRQALTVEAINSANSLPGNLVSLLFVAVALVMFVKSPNSGGNVGFLFSILLLVPQMMAPVQSISTYLVLMRNSWPSVEKVIGLLDSETVRTDGIAAKPGTATTNGDLRLGAKDLVFGYRPDLPPVFRGATFDFPPGKISGLVARMGQGKTTFFRLALRFYDPQGGQTLVGGAPTTDFDTRKLRQSIAMMSQFPAFFHDTLRENMKIANPLATDQEIEDACRRTGVWSILQEKFAGETKGEKANPLDQPFLAGRSLSGGQKKLLALTRCLLRVPTHILLDEPTVGMDNREKYELIPELRKACHGRTAVVVDHDVGWLLRFCDYFIVLDEGRVVQQGTGAELASQDGLFRELLKCENLMAQSAPTITAVGGLKQPTPEKQAAMPV
jgi:ATP-binding cassette subfamily B protein